MSVLVAKGLSTVLGSELTVGRINIGLLNRIIIDDLVLNDQSGKELLKIGRLSAKFEILPLFSGKISIGNVQQFQCQSGKTSPPGKHQLPIRARCFRFQRHRQEEEQSGPAHQLTPDTTRKGILRCVVSRKHSGQVQPATHPPVQHSCQHLAESAPERLD